MTQQILASVRGFYARDGPMDLDVRQGDVILLRGPNGSGKTSMLRALAGLPFPMPCEAARLGDEDAAALPADAIARRVALVPQDPRDALAGLTIEGEFRLRREKLPEALAALGEQEAATLSSGEARRVGLHLARRAPLLLLDEPAEGLDAPARELLVRLVRERRGAVVAVDHAGLLAREATRTVELGEHAPHVDLPEVPRADGRVLLEVDAGEVRLDGRTLRLPALALGPGLHALSGPNGSGKSTLLRAIAGLTPGVRARVHGGRARLQLPHARDLFTRDRVAHELPGTGCGLVPDALLDRHPLSLSGGEAQRVALAKTLGVVAPVYLLDEPEAHLDSQGRRLLMELIAQRVRDGACVLMATHDDALLARAQSVTHLGGAAS